MSVPRPETPLPAVAQRLADLSGDLPALPLVAQQALGLLAEPGTEPEQLQAVLARDPALALRVLRLANSAYYRRAREVSTLSAGVVLLGFKTIQTLVLSCAVQTVLALAGPLAGRLWEHSFASAAACRELGTVLGLGAAAREEAFLAGLFHDVGKGVLAAKFPGLYETPLGLSGERDALGFQHAELGRLLLEQWGVPPLLAAAVGNHHGPDPEPLARLVAAGDWLAWPLAPGVGSAVPAEPSALLAEAGLGEGALEEMRARVDALLCEDRGAARDA